MIQRSVGRMRDHDSVAADCRASALVACASQFVSAAFHDAELPRLEPEDGATKGHATTTCTGRLKATSRAKRGTAAIRQSVHGRVAARCECGDAPRPRQTAAAHPQLILRPKMLSLRPGAGSVGRRDTRLGL